MRGLPGDAHRHTRIACGTDATNNNPPAINPYASGLPHPAAVTTAAAEPASSAFLPCGRGSR